MAIALISDQPLEDNYALFENDEVSGQDQGEIEWTEPVEVSVNHWKVEFYGTNVQGGTIPTTTEEVVQSGAPTPGQVFWWLAEKLKDTLCPECI